MTHSFPPRRASDLEQVHFAKAGRDAAVAHDYCYLVQSFGQTGPELPVVLSATHAGSGIALDRVVQVGKFQRIAKEKYGCVVADQIPITFFGVELHGNATNIAFGISRSALAGDG